MTQLPDIIMGIPGAWKTRGDIVTSIAEKADGLLFAGEVLFNPATKTGYEVDIYEHDPNLVNAFAVAGRQSLTKADLEAVAAHTFTLYVIAKGASVAVAQSMLDIGARLLQAGGVAVKIESAGVAHSSKDWVQYANDKKFKSVYRSYVTKISDGKAHYSCGMHNIGLPDASVPGNMPADEAAKLLDGFLLLTLIKSPALKNGDTFHVDDASPKLALTKELCKRYPQGDPFYNPFGVWRMAPPKKFLFW